jgi:PIN domain nuclease of toxin-antitoxin system
LSLLLLDSHTLLWWRADDPRLSPTAREAIEDPKATPHFSAASIWELEIKQAKRQLALPPRLVDALAEEGFVEIAIGSHHATVAATLPPHHSDPFDRMLVAQAQSEHLTIVTRDARFAAYGVPVLW